MSVPPLLPVTIHGQFYAFSRLIKCGNQSQSDYANKDEDGGGILVICRDIYYLLDISNFYNN